MKWYLTLTIHQKINLKEECIRITGIEWSDLSLFFNIKERINLIYNKLQAEGFDI